MLIEKIMDKKNEKLIKIKLGDDEKIVDELDRIENFLINSFKNKPCKDFDYDFVCNNCKKQILSGEEYFVRDDAIATYSIEGKETVEDKKNAWVDKILCIHCYEKENQIDDCDELANTRVSSSKVNDHSKTMFRKM
jgi:hypothetical protein